MRRRWIGILSLLARWKVIKKIAGTKMDEAGAANPDWQLTGLRFLAVNFNNRGFCIRLHEATSSTPPSIETCETTKNETCETCRRRFPSEVTMVVEYRPISNKNYPPSPVRPSQRFQSGYKRGLKIRRSATRSNASSPQMVCVCVCALNEFRKQFDEKLWTHFRIIREIRYIVDIIRKYRGIIWRNTRYSKLERDWNRLEIEINSTRFINVYGCVFSVVKFTYARYYFSPKRDRATEFLTKILENSNFSTTTKVLVCLRSLLPTRFFDNQSFQGFAISFRVL